MRVRVLRMYGSTDIRLTCILWSKIAAILWGLRRRILYQHLPQWKTIMCQHVALPFTSQSWPHIMSLLGGQLFININCNDQMQIADKPPGPYMPRILANPLLFFPFLRCTLSKGSFQRWKKSLKTDSDVDSLNPTAAPIPPAFYAL